MAKELPRAVRDAWERARLAQKLWTTNASGEPRIERALGGGQSNTVWQVAGSKESWVLRVPDRHPPRGVNRHRELALHALAAAQGLAPELRYSEASTGVLLMPYLEFAQDSSSQAAESTILELATLFRAIHRLDWGSAASTLGSQPRAARDGDNARLWRPLNSATRLGEWRRALKDTDPLSAIDASTQQQLAASISRVTTAAVTPCVCHNDLLFANRLRDHRGRLLAIDWEYACLGDPFFDLAAATSELSPTASESLLRAYLGREATSAERIHLEDQQALYLAIALCWYTARRSNPAMLTSAAEALATHYTEHTT